MALSNADDQKRVGHAFLCWKVKALKFLRYCLNHLRKRPVGGQSIMLLCDEKRVKRS